MAIDIESCYRRHGPMVLRRCRRLLRDEDRARDAMHDVFVELLRRREHLDDAALSSLLFRIATNVSLNRMRHQARHPESPDDELISRIAQATDPRATAAARSALAWLFGSEPASTRTIAVLHYADGMTLEEVAGEVGLSVSGVRKRLR